MHIDHLLFVLILISMCYSLTGEFLHEWIGAITIVFFVIHNVLNKSWYQKLFKGTYTPMRMISLIVNLALILSVFFLALSGWMMSPLGFSNLSGFFSMSNMRLFHLVFSYWSFLLMAFHIGLHGPALLAPYERKNRKAFRDWIMLWLVASVYGFFRFIQMQIPSYLFFQNQFAFFDFSRNGLLVFTDYLSILLCFALLGYETARFLTKKKKRSS